MVIPESFRSSLFERMIGLIRRSRWFHDRVGMRFQGNPAKINGSSDNSWAIDFGAYRFDIEIRALRSPVVCRRRVAYSRVLGSACLDAIGSITI